MQVNIPNELSARANTCRVSNKLIWAQQPGGPALEANQRVYMHPTNRGAIFREHGTLRFDANPNNLPPYQRRSYTVPEYFNSGCTPLYCRDSDVVYPTGQTQCNGDSRMSSSASKALNSYFVSTDPYIGNSVPANAVCGKGVSANSTAGWLTINSGGKKAPLWTLQGAQ